MKYHRTDIVEAAIKRFGKRKKLALEEVGGLFRVRSVGGPMREVVIDSVRHLIERDVVTYAGPFNSLAECAQFFGVKKR
ncbi:MAG: hypothetical protein EPN91_08405 [Salinibacterium sp.]|nr:MAG: hypothetical protein EPN91_08405 [Salinibacterium sp.]